MIQTIFSPRYRWLLLFNVVALGIVVTDGLITGEWLFVALAVSVGNILILLIMGRIAKQQTSNLQLRKLPRVEDV